MRIRTALILILLTSLSFTNIYAGWYRCYNYQGAVGNYPVTLSLQVREGFFGEKDKQHFNIIGVYKYDKHNQPIKLEGTINFNDNKGLLYEVGKDKYTATFEIDFSESECQGVWKNLATDNTFPFHLTSVSKLMDTTSEDEYTNIDILQTNALPDYYFVGVYSKVRGVDRAQMTGLKIISKKDNIVFQKIDFTAAESQTGNVATIIFDNVEVVGAKTKSFIVSSNVGRMGGYLRVLFDIKKKKFIPNPIPEIEGPQ